MLDHNLFREDRDDINNPNLVRESQRLRYADVDVVDQIIHLDKQRRQCQYELDNLRQEFNKINREIARLKIAGEDATETIKNTKENKKLTAKKEAQFQEIKDELYRKLGTVGNLVHASVPISNDEANNAVIRCWGEKRMEPNLRNHVELMELTGIADTRKGGNVAGGRGYFLKGMGVLLNQALINFGLSLLRRRGYTLMQTPSLMRKDVMIKCAQLSQFDEELYKVTGEGDEKYLIATSEQPLCSYHQGEWINPKQLPLRYAGYSSCFRKEAGSHGKDTLGIFRVHQFEKVEQFCITSPNGNESWKMHEEMITNSEDFYQELKIPYQTVAVVSGALNNAAAKKYDLEGWFPASKRYRELVSCSNCTDYQSRRLEIRYGLNKNDEQAKQYVHMLNSTLVATERTICCILENYQKEDGVEIPEALLPYMDGVTFLPF
ncbi:serine--tRNA ligase-like [Quercus robur]|uniref:serine--tRNA ligase-like n=1 Tax=Quercus robur TaxID=38942 RepID=UPI0021619EA2|nr:serine--tRNA ligase-like [Quercus robur]